MNRCDSPDDGLPGDLPRVAGCGDGKPWVDTKLTECTVSGIVSVKGKPAKRRNDPVQSQQFRSHRRDADGRDRAGRGLHDQDLYRRQPGHI